MKKYSFLIVTCLIVVVQSQIYVDPSATATGDGSMANPYNSLISAMEIVIPSPNKQVIYLRGSQTISSSVALAATEIKLDLWSGYSASLNISDSASFIISSNLDISNILISWTNPTGTPFLDSTGSSELNISLTVSFMF